MENVPKREFYASDPPLSPQKVLKLARLFECFGLPDHAPELIKVNENSLSLHCDPQGVEVGW